MIDSINFFLGCYNCYRCCLATVMMMNVSWWIEFWFLNSRKNKIKLIELNQTNRNVNRFLSIDIYGDPFSFTISFLLSLNMKKNLIEIQLSIISSFFCKKRFELNYEWWWLMMMDNWVDGWVSTMMNGYCIQ